MRCVRRGKDASTLLLGEHDAEVIEFSMADRPARRDLVEKARLRTCASPKAR